MGCYSLKMPADLAARIDAVARRRGITRSALVREALRSHLRRAKTTAGSAAELASDLIGRFRGPRDLSHHPRHLRGFGA